MNDREAQIVAAKLTGKIEVAVGFGSVRTTFIPNVVQTVQADVRHNGHMWIVEVAKSAFPSSAFPVASINLFGYWKVTYKSIDRNTFFTSLEPTE